MNILDYLEVSPEIERAVAANKPVVALESTILSHGMPFPQNVEFAHKVEEIVRGQGAIPATTAIINGKLKVGLTAEELDLMCRADGIAKASRRDVATMVVSKKPAATTVATTMIIAAMAGIKVFATGGIGGVHRGAQQTFDISADLQELANTPVAVVCAGAKSLLDIGLTVEYLETMGVPIIGNETEDFPAFYCRKSGFKVDYKASGAAEIAKIAKTKWELGLRGGLVIANPIPVDFELDFDEMDAVITNAIDEAERKGIRGKHLTPFLLDTINKHTEDVSFKSNIQLAYNNALFASKVAVEMAKI